MSLVHAFVSAFGVCFAIFSVWRPQALVSGFGLEAERNRAIVRFCGAVILGLTAVEGVEALLARG
jgi:hypothetical protein